MLPAVQETMIEREIIAVPRRENGYRLEEVTYCNGRQESITA